MQSHRCRPTAGHIAAIVLFGLAAIALFPLAVQLLWNHVLVAILGVVTITYWQALGLLVLCKLLFGGFPGGRGCCRSRRCCGPRGDDESCGKDSEFHQKLRRHFCDDEDNTSKSA